MANQDTSDPVRMIAQEYDLAKPIANPQPFKRAMPDGVCLMLCPECGAGCLPDDSNASNSLMLVRCTGCNIRLLQPEAS